jgi:predicted DNA-binding transcriptional regulator AlpA
MARPGDRLTIAQLCEELGVSRSTFYEWRAKGRAPAASSCPTARSVSAGPSSSAGLSPWRRWPD